MNPQVTPNQPLQPAPTQQSPQGVTSIMPNVPPTPSALPTAQKGQLPAPLQNPAVNPSAGLDMIAQYYQIPRETALNVAQTQATGEQARQQTAANTFQAGVKESNLRDQLDAGKYKVTQDPNSPNGIAITNSLGQQVDLGTYVNLTGSNPAQVLAQSADPKAQQFVQAYQNFEDLMKTTLAASSGDEQAKIRLGDYYSANPGLKNMKPDDVSKLFMERYGQYFGMPQQQAPQGGGVTQNFGNLNSPITQSPYYQMQYYPQLGQANPEANQLLGGGGAAGTPADYTAMLNGLIQQGATPPGG